MKKLAGRRWIYFGPSGFDKSTSTSFATAGLQVVFRRPAARPANLSALDVSDIRGTLVIGPYVPAQRHLAGRQEVSTSPSFGGIETETLAIASAARIVVLAASVAATMIATCMVAIRAQLLAV